MSEVLTNNDLVWRQISLYTNAQVKRFDQLRPDQEIMCVQAVWRASSSERSKGWRSNLASLPLFRGLGVIGLWQGTITKLEPDAGRVRIEQSHRALPGNIQPVELDNVHTTLEQLPLLEEIEHTAYSLGMAPANEQTRMLWQGRWLPHAVIDLQGLEQHRRWGS